VSNPNKLSIDYFGVVPGPNDTVAHMAKCKKCGYEMVPHPVWKLRYGINTHCRGSCAAKSLRDFDIS